MKSTVWRCFASCSVLAVGIAWTPEAFAQAITMVPTAARADSGTDDETGLHDIVVTAQRRGERLQDVPIAISAFSSDDLEARGIASPFALTQYVPNMIGTHTIGVGSSNNYFLRGLGSTEPLATFDPAVGTYVDDIYIGRLGANDFGLFDVERIEVLRGPQGTLFGRNTTGGAVSVIMKKPSSDLSGFGEISYGRYDAVKSRGSIDIPLSRNMSAKISGFFQTDKGSVRNLTTGERLNDNDGYGLRGALRADLSESVSWNGAVSFVRNDGDNFLNFRCDASQPVPPAACGGRYATSGLRQSLPLGTSQFGGLLNLSTFTPATISGRKNFFALGNQSKNIIISSNLQIALGEQTLSLITGYVDLRQKGVADLGDGRATLPSVANPAPAIRGFSRGLFTIVQDSSTRQFTQEIKLNGTAYNGTLDYVFGAYFLDERNKTDFADIFTSAMAPGDGLGLLLADRSLSNNTTSYAGYLQVDGNLSDRLKLTAGIRYTDEQKRLKLLDNRAVCQVAIRPTFCLSSNALIAANGVPIPTKLVTRIWTPRFAVNFKPNATTLLFASATRGFKSGGWNGRSQSNDTLLSFNPEKVWSYEVGVKSELFNRRLRVNITGFALDVADFQIATSIVGPTGTNFFTRNPASFRNRGIEAELTVAPVKGLSLYASVGYQHASYKIDAANFANDVFGVQSVAAQQVACRAQLAAGKIALAPGAANASACAGGIVNASGDIAQPARTPTWTISAGGTYDFDLDGPNLIISPTVNLSYSSSWKSNPTGVDIFNGPNGTSYPANTTSGPTIITGSTVNPYTIVNASIMLHPADQRWSVGVECENCFGAVYGQSFFSGHTYLSAPGTWSVRARRKF